MSYPKRDFSAGSFYHIFNKTIDGKTPFLDPTQSASFLRTVHYYRGCDLQTSYSRLKELTTIQQSLIIKQLENPCNFRVNIVAYCLMPNHFHFVLKQVTTHGVKEFISNVSNSYTRAFNTKYHRKGPLFLHRFHAVTITSAKHLLDVSRYVHLNPIAKSPAKIGESFHTYQWSSYKDYLNPTPDPKDLTQPESVLKYFNNDPKLYQEFVEEDFHS